MKKIGILVIVGILVISSVGAVVSSNVTEQNNKERLISQTFSIPFIEDDGEYSRVILGNANSVLNEPGCPVLPMYQQTLVFPFGTMVQDVIVSFSEPKAYRVSFPIVLGSSPMPLIDAVQQINMEVSFNQNMYPATDFTYFVGSGLQGREHVVFLTISVYPVKYVASGQRIWSSDQVDITVRYQEPEVPIGFGDAYDLLIIAPEKFASLVDPLVAHKNAMGVATILKTTESIYSEYAGRDKPEKIKYCVKDMLDTTGITYVLLIGGLNSILTAIPRDDANQGDIDWYLPVRYTNLYDGGTVQDPGYISDLYYADIYDGVGNFSSWDSNENDIFGEWRTSTQKDIIDLYPDVYIGRLPCRNTLEVRTMVKKIIKYEETSADPSWFNKMVVVGSDTFNDVAGNNFYEGEVETQKSLDYMTDFTPVKIWGSNRDTGELVPVPKDIIMTVSKGCGFLAFAGHGSPERWNSYWPEGFDEERLKGLWWWNMPVFYNGNKLPVCVVGGCHNSQFNVTSLGFLRGDLWVYGPVPECWSWLLTRKIGGGAIATIGNTGLGYGAVGNSGDLDGDGIDEPDCVETLGGYLETQFFKAYGIDNKTVLGDAWGAAVTTYLNVFPPMLDKFDCKTVEQWALLGDPSLLIGGYSL